MDRAAHDRATHDRAGGSGDTLAQRLEQGPLPLGEALRCARDIANHLRELHEEGRVHGEVVPRLVMLRQSGNVLMPPNAPPNDLGSIADIHAFGVMLYQMLTGRKPTPEELLSTPIQAPPRKGPGAIYAAAIRLAERSITAVPESGASMQKALIELRLLSVQARQWEDAGQSAGQLNTPERLSPAASPARPAVSGAVSELPATLPESSNGKDVQETSAESDETDESAADEKEDLMADGRCPRCRCSKVRPSRPRNRLERFLKVIGFPVVRCHRCYFRYVNVFKACLEMPTKKFNR